MERTTILIFSIPLAALLVAVSCTGLFIKDFYNQETLNWQVQSVGQDAIDLFLVVPSLLITALLAMRKGSKAVFMWAGVVLYLLYTFAIYCFSVHFNQLFLAYCLALGLAFYSFAYFLFIQIKHGEKLKPANSPPDRFTAFYLIIISIVFYLLWLMEVIPAVVSGKQPKSLSEAGLFTNPVHVIDLSVFLPGIFITGWLLLSKHFIGYVLTPVLLSFFVLMDITIASLMLMMKQRGLEASNGIAAVMFLLALASAALLFRFLKLKVKQE